MLFSWVHSRGDGGSSCAMIFHFLGIGLDALTNSRIHVGCPLVTDSCMSIPSCSDPNQGQKPKKLDTSSCKIDILTGPHINYLQRSNVLTPSRWLYYPQLVTNIPLALPREPTQRGHPLRLQCLLRRGQRPVSWSPPDRYVNDLTR